MTEDQMIPSFLGLVWKGGREEKRRKNIGVCTWNFAHQCCRPYRFYVLF